MESYRKEYKKWKHSFLHKIDTINDNKIDNDNDYDGEELQYDMNK